MTLDLPDYTRKMILELNSTKDFIGDLANRLGFPLSINSTGDVIAFTNFSNGLKEIVKYGLGAGYDHQLAADHYYTGGFSLQLSSGSEIDGSAAINLHANFSGTSKFGYEARFTSNDDLKYMHFDLDFPFPANSCHFGLRYKMSDHTLAVLDEGVFIEILTLGLSLDNSGIPLNVIKFVVDLNTLKYDYVIINNEYVDLSFYKCDVYSPTVRSMLTSNFQIMTEGDTGKTVWLDSIVLTKNEVV